MRLRNTAIALILLAGLLGFIYYYEYLGEESRETAEESGKKVLSFEGRTYVFMSWNSDTLTCAFKASTNVARICRQPSNT